jgi:hypothetical protein
MRDRHKGNTMAAIASRLTHAICTAGLLFCVLLALPAGAEPAATDTSTGVLVVTPDRGFLGNDEIRDAFDEFAKGRNAELLYVTDARSEKILDEELGNLAQRGAKRIEVLPLVMSSADARWKLAEGWLDARRQHGTRLAIAEPYGASYLAVEDLSARLRDVHADKQRLLLVGYGAGDPAAAATMRDELKRMGGFASTLAPAAIDAVVYPARKAKDADAMRKHVTDAIHAAHGALVVPVAFAPRDDSMMDFSGWFSDDLPKDAQRVDSPIATRDALAQWMQRAGIEAGMQFAPLDPSQIGVVALTHGADWFWNRDIEQALAPVAARHKLAYAFSMADPPVVERAVRKLEKENVRAIVVVRAFGMASSFRGSVERMIGADVENGASTHGGHAMHGGGMGMMHHGTAGMSLAAPPRIRSALPMVTVGGVNDDPLFAKALLANARSVSRHPSRETVILVAHGQGDDAGNRQWLDLLGSLAKQMRADGGGDFHAIRYATWREDWPDKNKAAVKRVRAMVTEADRDGGRALIVPARINGRGAADTYLKGLDFGWSQGFAQTPYFAQWFEQEITRGIAQVRQQAEHASRTQ